MSVKLPSSANNRGVLLLDKNITQRHSVVFAMDDFIGFFSTTNMVQNDPSYFVIKN